MVVYITVYFTTMQGEKLMSLDELLNTSLKELFPTDTWGAKARHRARAERARTKGKERCKTNNQKENKRNV